MQLGTTANNASGSLLLTNLTASGTVTAVGIQSNTNGFSVGNPPLAASLACLRTPNDYRILDNGSLDFNNATTRLMRIGSTGNVVVTGNATVSEGSAAAPSLQLGSTATGFYISAGGTTRIGVVHAGSVLAQFATTDIRISNGMMFSSSNSGTATGGSVDVSMSRFGVSTWQIGNGGVNASGSLNLTNLTASGTVTAQNSIKLGTAGAGAPGFFTFTGNTHTTPDPTGRGLNVYSYVSAAGSTSIAFGGEPFFATSGINTHLLVQRTFQPTSGTGTYSLATITTTINQTGGANGITRGLFINPTLTAAADFRGIDVGNCGSQTAIRTGTGLVSFGDSVSITGNLTTSGTLRVGGGTVVASILSATATLDFPSIGSNGTETLTMTVTGAVAGDSVFLGVPAGLDAGLIFCASVTAADTVTVRMHNSSGGSTDPASGTFRATVIRF
jgi:hypothetical protein